MGAKVSPIVVEIIRNAVNSAAREMNSCLIKSAFGPGIYEMKDCSTGGHAGHGRKRSDRKRGFDRRISGGAADSAGPALF